ncbi:hypothetical protein FM076_01195 [Streptomyces albus subsp. chlorinus]|uniref:hypothetical protein n=1 Tax=Streptomyces albus TaxID=1888 RepID=UPI00156E7A5B|nr:hypothetical protein [Streptomyces albus]NSC19897.1 hypothetical protein [Streptomyces albus subsp. chlorinus]
MASRTLTASVIVASLLGLAVATGPAHAAAKEPVSGKRCAVIVGKAPKNGVSPVVGTACSRKSSADALAKATAEVKEAHPGLTPRLSTQTHLLRLYEHANYEYSTGFNYWDAYGLYGPCDGDGYYLRLGTTLPFEWGNVLSSVKGFNQCNYATFTDKGGTKNLNTWLPVPNLGAWNDNVGVIRTMHR